MCKLPYPIAIAAGRSLEEPSLRAVVPPEARRPPPRVAELARVRVARVAAVNRRAVLRDRGAGAQDRGEHGERRAVDGQDADVRHRAQVVERAPALVDDDVAGPEALDDLICVAGALGEDHDRRVAPGQQVVQFLRIALETSLALSPSLARGEAVKRESAFAQVPFSMPRRHR